MQLFSIPERKTGPPRNERGQGTTIFLKKGFGFGVGIKTGFLGLPFLCSALYFWEKNKISRDNCWNNPPKRWD